MTEYDSPWKEALDVFFEPFIKLLFPQIYREIDWTRGFESMDSELQKIAPRAEIGRRHVDKLVSVWRNSGEEEWILIHIEVQNQKDAEFPFRMFVYHYRVFDRYNRSVVSLAVLGDEHRDWRPGGYRREMWGCSIDFRFPMVKLIDLIATGELDRSENPFAVFVLAHVTAQQKSGDADFRYNSKWQLVRPLYEKGFSAETVRQLFRFIDWLIELPDEMNHRFNQELYEFEQEANMPFVTSIERLAEQRGLEKGLEKGSVVGTATGIKERIEVVLRSRFDNGEIEPLIALIREIDDLAVLRKLLQQAIQADSADNLMKVVREEL